MTPVFGNNPSVKVLEFDPDTKRVLDFTVVRVLVTVLPILMISAVPLVAGRGMAGAARPDLGHRT